MWPNCWRGSGYVVLGIDNYFNGERKGAGPAGSLETMARNADQEMSLFKLNLWLGRTLWGMMLRDEQIALDYLASRPEVDPAAHRRAGHEHGQYARLVAGGHRRPHQGGGRGGLLHPLRGPDRHPRAARRTASTTSCPGC